MSRESDGGRQQRAGSSRHGGARASRPRREGGDPVRAGLLVAAAGVALARQIGSRSTVLAANPRGLLPLDPAAVSSVAVIGALAKDAHVLGGGSATVFPAHVVSPLEGLRAALPDSVKLIFATGADVRTDALTPAAATVVVVNAGSPVELPWADDVGAVLLTWFGGQEAGNALADVLLGDCEPGGRLPTTWPVRETDCPVLTTPGGGVRCYDEGVFIGYRAYERAGVEPRYPFGHGLGYTTWEYEGISADRRAVTITVRNTGARAGREVIQVYAGPLAADPDRPRRWLAGFAAVWAEPGEARTVTIGLPERTFGVWAGPPTAGGWRTVGGDYVLEAARSRADVRRTTTVRVA